jgi:hypothetical protein
VTTHSFSLVIDGDAGTDERIDALFEAGCDDALFGHGPWRSYGDFDREAGTLIEAVLSAIEAVESVDGLVVRRVNEFDLVNVTELASRLGRTRQSVNQLVSGTRGDGSFPPPLDPGVTEGRVWAWSEVAAWAGIEHDQESAAILQAVNAALALRRAGLVLSKPDQRRLLHIVSAA